MEESEKYIKGFNSGYTLRQHSPKLAKELIDLLKEQSDYIQGLKDGKLQFEKELDKEIYRWAEQHKGNVSNEPSIKKDKDIDTGKDYDNL